MCVVLPGVILKIFFQKLLTRVMQTTAEQRILAEKEQLLARLGDLRNPGHLLL